MAQSTRIRKKTLSPEARKEARLRRKAEKSAKYKGRIFGGTLVHAGNYNDFTKQERADAAAHLKAFLRGRTYYRYGTEMVQGPNDFDYAVPRIRAVVSFTTEQYEKMKQDESRNSERDRSDN